jgi:hypothetical protein
MKRGISITLGLAAYVLPALWLWWQYQHVEVRPGGGCGLWLLFAYFWGAALAVLLSGTSVWLGVVGWRRLERPRPFSRLVELAAFALPGVAGVAMIGLIVCG